MNIKVHLTEEILQVLEDTLVAACICGLWISDDDSEGSSTLADLVLVSITTDLQVREVRHNKRGLGKGELTLSLKIHLAVLSGSVSLAVNVTCSVDPCLMNLDLGTSDQYNGT